MTHRAKPNGQRVNPLDFDAVRMLIHDIQALESRAHRLKMTAAGQALNAAMNKAGWEFEQQVQSARKTALAHAPGESR